MKVMKVEQSEDIVKSVEDALKLQMSTQYEFLVLDALLRVSGHTKIRKRLGEASAIMARSARNGLGNLLVLDVVKQKYEEKCTV